jgi:hypothetical protein
MPRQHLQCFGARLSRITIGASSDVAARRTESHPHQGPRLVRPREVDRPQAIPPSAWGRPRSRGGSPSPGRAPRSRFGACRAATRRVPSEGVAGTSADRPRARGLEVRSQRRTARPPTSRSCSAAWVLRRAGGWAPAVLDRPSTSPPTTRPGHRQQNPLVRAKRAYELHILARRDQVLVTEGVTLDPRGRPLRSEDPSMAT